jgi:hypothetical protein
MASQGDELLRQVYGIGLDRPDAPGFSHLVRWAATARLTRLFTREFAASVAGEDPAASLIGTMPARARSWRPLARALTAPPTWRDPCRGARCLPAAGGLGDSAAQRTFQVRLRCWRLARPASAAPSCAARHGASGFFGTMGSVGADPVAGDTPTPGATWPGAFPTGTRSAEMTEFDGTQRQLAPSVSMQSSQLWQAVPQRDASFTQKPLLGSHTVP